MKTWQEAAAAAAGEIHTEMASLRLTPYHLARLVDATIMQMAARMELGQVQQPRHEFIGMAVTAINGYMLATGDRDAMQTVLTTIASKQRDYGHDNINRFGETGLVVRLSDKAARLINLIRRDDAAMNEPLTDTWQDIVGYCVLALMVKDGTFGLPLVEDS